MMDACNSLHTPDGVQGRPHRVRVESQDRGRLGQDTPSRSKVNIMFKVQGQGRFKTQGQVYIIKDDHVPALLRTDGEEMKRGTRRSGRNYEALGRLWKVK